MTPNRNSNGPVWAVSPKDWGAQINYDEWTDRVYDKDAIAIHHGGSGDYLAAQQPFSQAKEAALLRTWESYHLSKGWRGLGYGFGVGMTGIVYRIRGWNNYGAHLGDHDGDAVSNNKEIVPVILLMSGMPNRHSPSKEMLAGFHRLRSYLEHTEDQPLPLYGHQEIQTDKHTSCPGVNNMAWIRANRSSRGELATPPQGISEVGLLLPVSSTVTTVKEEEESVPEYVPVVSESYARQQLPPINPQAPLTEPVPSPPTPPIPLDDQKLIIDLQKTVKAFHNWVKQEQKNLNRAGFRNQKGERLKVDGIGGPKTNYARLQRDTAATKTGIAYGVPIVIQEIKS